MPISISLEHNSSYSDSYELHMRGGWKINYDLTLGSDMSSSDPSMQSYYMDSDGTKHFFYIESWDGETIGTDEDGLGLTLDRLYGVDTTDLGKITDQSNNTMWFNSFKKLYKMVDKNGNQINITFNSNNRILTISNSEGHVYSFEYFETGSTHVGQLKSITDPAGVVTTFDYTIIEDESYLNKITFSDGLTVEYTYNTDGELVSIKNADGTITDVTYSTNYQTPVSSLSLVNSTKTVTDTKYNFVYDHCKTVISEINNGSAEYQFDNYGHTICVVDNETENVTYTESGAVGVLEGTSTPVKTAHKPVNASYSMQAAPNLYANGGFDNGINEFSSINYEYQTYDTTVGRSKSGSLKLNIPTQYSEYGTVAGIDISGVTLRLNGESNVASVYVTTNGTEINGKGAVLAIYSTYEGSSDYYQVVKSQPVYYTGEGEWVKLSVEIPDESESTYTLVLGVEQKNNDSVIQGGGTVWFDDLHVSYEQTPSFNMLPNAGFSEEQYIYDQSYMYYRYSYVPSITGWSKSSTVTDLTTETYSAYHYGITFTGNPDDAKNISSTMSVSGSAGDTYSFGGFAKASSIWTNGYDRGIKIVDSYIPTYSIDLAFYYNNEQVGAETIDFNPYFGDWQYAGGTAVAPASYDKIVYTLNYDHNIGAIHFKRPFVSKEVTAQFYDYDENGNLVTSSTSTGSNSTMQYNDDNLLTQVETDDSVSNITYNDNNEITKTVDNAHYFTDYTYNTFGQMTSSSSGGVDFSNSVTEFSDDVYYHLVNQASLGMLLDDFSVTTSEYTSGDAHLWLLTDNLHGGGIHIKPAYFSDKSLTPYYDDQNGVYDYNVVELSYITEYNEYQAYDAIQNSDGSVRFVNRMTDGLCLTLGWSENPMSLQPYTESPNQKWFVIPYNQLDIEGEQTSSTVEFSQNGEYLIKQTDALGNYVSYNYNTTGANKYLPESVTDAKGNKTTYSYDSYRRVDKVASNGSWVDYNYDSYGRLNEVSKNNAEGTSETLSYKIEYDEFGKQTAWKSQGANSDERVVASYAYNTKGLLTGLTYGNSQSVSYAYNSDNQVTSTTSSGAISVNYTYDSLGRLAKAQDNINDIDTYYAYDSNGRTTSFSQYKPESYRNEDGNYEYYDALLQSVSNQYDEDGNKIAVSQYAKNFGVNKTSVLYGTDAFQDSSLIYSVSHNGAEKISYTYNAIGQRTNRKLHLSDTLNLNTTFDFFENTETGETSAFLKTFTNEGGRKYNYIYDSAGNITSITDSPASGTGTSYTSSYTYDANNQLTQYINNKFQKKFTYTYDKGGNILSKSEYDLNSTLIDTVNYTYDNEDKLLSYDGDAITYDGSGNPLSYRGMTFTWQAGRRLSRVVKNGVTTTFKYNVDGIRTKKGTTEYIVSGSDIVEIINGSTAMLILRDENGVPYGFRYKPSYYNSSYTDYYFVYNGQGDVVSLINSSGSIVANYEYDVWGKLLSVTDANGAEITTSTHIAHRNPFRYRGYVYDSETGLYYLQSRYYDPETGRFINADSGVGMNRDMTAYNLYVYCGNNPISRYDSGGAFWKELISGILHAGNDFARWLGFDTAAIGSVFLDMKKDSRGIYHAKFDCWQQYFGYNEVYDFFFDLGTSMKPAQFIFTYKGEGYTIWAWKGDYINLGAGAELGIYRGTSGHRTVDTSLAMWMGMAVVYKGILIFDYYPEEYQWWITGFNPKYQRVNAADLLVTFGLEFNDYGMYCALRDEFNLDSRWTFFDGMGLAVFQF